MNLGAKDFTAMRDAAMLQSSDLVGHYHRNVRMDHEGDSFVVRVPNPRSQVMDLAIWAEHLVLLALSPDMTRVPRLYYCEEDPYFQVQGFIEGELVEDLCPRGSTIAPGIAEDVTHFFEELLSFPAEKVPGISRPWPRDGDSQGFAGILLKFGHDLRVKCSQRMPRLFSELGIPESPFEELGKAASGLTSRPFRLLHGDIHRGNMISDDGRTYFLDWQLALWGDPVYDLADHVHKMFYTPADAKRAVDQWAEVAPDSCGRGMAEDLEFYLGYERVKSAIVDTVRGAEHISKTVEGSKERADAVQQLTGKINRARPYWAPAFREPLEPLAVAEAVVSLYGRG
ncbi:aminoglycoside phosphotransferase family protein [Streptomyces sp. NPDC050392]|uniref:aminoglycoside phosphotransferase family protein n=1 Tax=Streptomyces sp. NPDC050392 TaxID=3155782 RepID=UPI00341CC6A8